MTVAIGRRRLIAAIGGAVVTWPLGATGQSKMPVIGFLHGASPDAYVDILASLRQGLHETGYVEGHNLTIDYRWAEGHDDRLPALAVDLVSKRVAVIVASTIRASLAAKAATSEIPIVFSIGSDPVRLGLVASLNRPGGNVTGISYLAAALGEKRVSVLHDLIPSARIFGVIVNPNTEYAQVNVTNLQQAVHTLGARTVIANASTEDDFDAAISLLIQHGVQAVIVLNDPLFTNRRTRLVSLIARRGIPTMYPLREYVTSGGLVSYGASINDAHRQAGLYAGRILNGDKPSDLPVVQPTKFELVINLKTATALGLTVAPTLLATADEVIE